MKKSAFIFLRILVSFSLIWLLLWIMRDQLAQIAHNLISANKFIFVSIFLLNIFITFFLAYRMKILLEIQNINLGLKEAFKFSMIGYFFNNFLPTSVGGDMIKAYLVSKTTKHKRLESFTGVFVDRICGMIAIVSIAAVTLIFVSGRIENKVIFLLVYMLLGLAILFAILIFNRNFARKLNGLTKRIKALGIGERLKRIYDAINIYKDHKITALKAFFVSFLAQILSIAGLYLLARSIVAEIPLSIFFLVMPLIITASMLPSLNGLGIREGAFVYFLAPMMGKENSFVLSLLWLGIILLLSLVGGIMYAFYGQINYRKAMVENDR